jgi:hypothetical protein
LLIEPGNRVALPDVGVLGREGILQRDSGLWPGQGLLELIVHVKQTLAHGKTGQPKICRCFGVAAR